MTRLRTLLVPTLAALVLVPLFCGLGFWQLRRAEEKQALQAEYDRRAAAPPVTLHAAPVAVDEVQYARVQARGVYETEYQVLWDNRIHNGVPGYHVLTPFRIENSAMRVLVNRGWVPAPPSRSELPDVAPPSTPVAISGTAVVPRVDFLLGELDPLTRTPPTVWQQIDLERYAAQVDWPLQPIVILLDPASPGGYVREWARLDAGIAVHWGYAFQWFALAATAVVVYGVLVVRWHRRNSPARGRT
ncbi:MAG TPA: SURF1 family protein [Burkholderiales bacterium]